jgi:hypothetical protein
MIREAVFECTYASGEVRRVAYVRAWDEAEAVERFTDELREEGVPGGGKISVRSPRGGAPSSTSDRLH